MTTQSPARDRNGLAVLSYDDCLERLGSGSVGRIALLDAGTPTIRPVTYTMDGATIVFRSLVGSKLDAAERSRPVAFEIDDHDPEARAGWSVLVTGVAELVDDPDEVAHLESLGLVTWALPDADEASWVRLRPEAITGRAATAAG